MGSRKRHKGKATREKIQRENGRTIEDSRTRDKVKDARTRDRHRRIELPTEDSIHRENGRTIEHTKTRNRRRRIELPDAENGDAKRRKQGETRKDEPPKEEKVERQPLELGRSGEVYNPSLEFAQTMKHVDDKSSAEYQRLTWKALRKSITGLVNKINGSNLKSILPELFSENLIRGRGVFARFCMKSQLASPTFTHVYAALVAVVNFKVPELGELLLKRIVSQLLRAYRRNNKPVLLATVKFIAHLVNQRVAHETIALDLLALLLEMPSEEDVEVAVDFVTECGGVLQNLSPRTLHHIFEWFRDVLEEGEIDMRVQFMIEDLFALRKARFHSYQGVLPELDLIEERDQITHVLNLDDKLDDEASLDVFRVDPNFLENERKYELIKKEILGEEPDHDCIEDGDKASHEKNPEEDEEDQMEQRNANSG